MEHSEEVAPLLRNLSKDNMEKNLEHFTSFHTRYYRSAIGVESATWLYNQVLDVIKETGASKHGATVEQFSHPWGQFSIIARVPGQTNKTVVLGAHQDSINLFLPSILAAPGADDDGSGTVTILEGLRGLLQSDTVAQGKAPNTVEFHWYSAEEGGMLGSQAIFSQYKKDKRDVKAMLQQDMTGYIQGSFDAGRKEAIGIMVDYVDRGLTQFLKDVIKEVRLKHLATDIGAVANMPLSSTARSDISRPSAAMLVLTTHRRASTGSLLQWQLSLRWRTATRRFIPPMIESSI